MRDVQMRGKPMRGKPMRWGIVAAAIVAVSCWCGIGRQARAQGREACAVAIAKLDDAVAKRDRTRIEHDGFDLGNVFGCDPDEVTMHRRAAARALADLADAARLSGAPSDDLQTRYTSARRVGAVWEAVKGLADLAFDARDYATAARLYGDVLNALDDPYPGDPTPPDGIPDFAFRRASETQMLAPVLIPPMRDGTPGGLDAVLEPGAQRDIVPRARPLPVTFQFDSAEMTDEGRVFAGRWWDQVKVLGTPALVLVGHTDPRGSATRNEPLSVQRAIALGNFLHAQGFSGTITTVGYGSRCPVDFSTGAHYTDEQRWTILRRVDVLAAADVPAGFCHGQAPRRAP